MLKYFIITCPMWHTLCSSVAFWTDSLNSLLILRYSFPPGRNLPLTIGFLFSILFLIKFAGHLTAIAGCSSNVCRNGKLLRPF